MGSYDEMLVRLEKYRKSIHMKQKQMGQAIGVSQEQYSYLENGNTKLTDKNLKALADTGADIDYIITGELFNIVLMSLRTRLTEPVRNVILP